MDRYSRELRWLHWGVAFLVLIQIQIALTLAGLPGGASEGRGIGLAAWHTAIGLLIALAMIARIVLRLRQGAPRIEGRIAPAAHLAHAGIYLLILGLVATGYVKIAALGAPVPLPGGLALPGLAGDPALAAQAQRLHTLFGNTLVGLLMLHVAAAMAHGTVLPGKVLYKMMPGEGRPER
ncbi:MAG: cytochrome b [Rubricella sp.]